MLIVVNDKHRLLSQVGISKAESRTNAAFAKFGHNVKSINISIQDVNGSRGGIDKECRVLVRLKKTNDIAVTVHEQSVSKAVSSAINRAARSVGRSLKQRTLGDRGRLSKFGLDY